MTPAVGLLCAGDLAHGVVEGQAEDLDMEVNGVAGQVAFGPAPVAVFDDEAGISGQNKIAGLACDELESAFLQAAEPVGPAGRRGFVRAVQRTFLSNGLVTVFSPVGLDEDAVDLFEVHDAGLVADGFDQRAQAQVAGAAQKAFAGADDEGQGFGGEGVVAQPGAVELVEDKRLRRFREPGAGAAPSK